MEILQSDEQRRPGMRDNLRETTTNLSGPSYTHGQVGGVNSPFPHFQVEKLLELSEVVSKLLRQLPQDKDSENENQAEDEKQ